MTGSTYHPRTPTPLTNLIHLRLGETTHREKPLSHDLLAKLVRHITIGTPWRAESATSDRHSRVRQSPFPSPVPLPPSPRQSRRPLSPTPHCSRSSSVFSLAPLALSFLGPPVTDPVFPSILRGACLAPKNKRKTTTSTRTVHQGRGRGRSRGKGEGTQLASTVTNDHCLSMAPLRGRSLPAARDHEGPLNNRAMRRRPVALPISLLPSTYPIRVATPCFSLRSADARARERERPLSVKTATRHARAQLQKRTSPSLSGAIFAVSFASYFTVFSLRSPGARARVSPRHRPCARTFSYYRYIIYPDARAIGPRRPPM